MPEEQTTETTETAETVEPTETETQNTVETDVRQTPAFKAVIAQLNDYKTKEAEQEAEKQRLAEEKAKEAGDFELIEKGYKEKIAALELSTATKDVNNLLLEAGMVEKRARKGVVAEYLENKGTIEDVQAWINNIKETESHLFKVQATGPDPVSHARVGSVGSSSPLATLQARVEKGDRAARMEKASMINKDPKLAEEFKKHEKWDQE